MAAYAALISLSNTIDRILNHSRLSISLEENQQILSLREYVTSFEAFLENFPGKSNSVEGRMMELAHEAEDIIEYFMLEQLKQSGKHELHLEKVMEEIGLIDGEVQKRFLPAKFSKFKSKHHMKKLRKAFDSIAGKVMRLLRSSSTASPIHKDVMIGFEDYVIDLKDRLCGEPSKKLQVIPICGMGGIGKTTLARNVYRDPLIMSHFDIRVWLTISQDFSPQRILSSVVESLKEFDTGGLGQRADEKVHKILMGRRYLVVMDDMWSSEAWDVVRRVFPDDGNGSRVMLTTRLSDVASYPNTSSKHYELSLLNIDQSWDLLKQSVFGDEDCPSELEHTGKKIARSCKGLPLAIVVVAGLLSTASRSVASWQGIAKTVKSAETVKHGQIEDILSLSYNALPQYLRPCFLYMGSFPEDEEIYAKKLIRLWIAESYIKSPTDSDSFEKVAEECLEELVKRNLVLVTKWKWDGRIKSFSLHDLMRDLCIRKAHEAKFFLNLMDRYTGEESFIENVKNQRGVSVKSYSLMFLPSLNGSSIHSIKCSCHHSGKLDFFDSVRLLRVLDAEPLYVQYLQPLVHLHELFHLRYFAIRYDQDIPRSFLMLQNLETLIIHGGKKSSIGVERGCNLQLTWCMSQLRHVCFRGKIMFEYPDESTCPLENLQTLAYVSHQSCTQKILKLIPNLKKLKIDCSDNDHREGIVCLNNLVHLHQLEDLQIYAGDWEGERPGYYKISFPKSLKKLSLKKLKLPWDNIFVVGSLPNLQVLKLKYCTCVGGTWETTEGAFPSLEVLIIKDASGFEDWITESSHFPKLKCLQLDSCEDLNWIPNDIGEIPTLQLIMTSGYAKKSLVESVEQIEEEQEDLGNTLHVSIRFQIRRDDDHDDDDVPST